MGHVLCPQDHILAKRETNNCSTGNIYHRSYIRCEEIENCHMGIRKYYRKGSIQINFMFSPFWWWKQCTVTR